MFPIEAVLFDYGMVLSAPRNPGVWKELAEVSGLSEDELERAYWINRDHYDAGALTGEDFWSGIGASAGFTYSADQLFALNSGDVRLWGDVNQPMLDWVQELHKAGFRTGILSNMGDRMAEGLCERFDWIGDFHHTVWSHEHRIRKPQPEIYALALKGLGVPAERILFIDDKEENTRAAEAFGMQAIVYRSHDDFEAQMRARGYGALLHPAQLASPGI